MQVFRVTMRLLDYVFYATVERGKVYETGAFIHNYALAYALGLVRGETYQYGQRVQKPHYEEELTPLNERLYLTPAGPRELSYRLVQWNTMREDYAFPAKPPSLGYPDWGFARVLRPEGQLGFYLLAPNADALSSVPALRELLAGKTVRVRLGKSMGKTALQAEAAQSVSIEHGPFAVEAYLNWQDLEQDPVACDVVAMSLPTRLLARAHFAGGTYYGVRFGDEIVRLPLGMRFLARSARAAVR